jgi:hypothetical protein
MAPANDRAPSIEKSRHLRDGPRSSAGFARAILQCFLV